MDGDNAGATEALTKATAQGAVQSQMLSVRVFV